MFDFGEFEGSSRAVASDSDFDSTQRLTTELTEDGQKFKNSESKGNILCIFSGLQGFAEMYINSQLSDVTLLSKSFIIPADPVDEDELKRKQLVLSVYKLKQLLIVIYSSKYDLSHFFIQELVNSEINGLLQSSFVTYIFTSESVAKFRNNYCQRVNYFLKSTCFKDQDELKGLYILPVPNIISGFSASVLTHCEKENKPCLNIINYLDNNDTSDLPFLKFVQSSPTLKSAFTFDHSAFLKLNRAKADTSYLFT